MCPVEDAGQSAHMGADMAFARIFKLLLALALAVGSSLATPAAAMIAMPASGDIRDGHCLSMSAPASGHHELPDGQDSPAAQSCCAATCLGTALAPGAMAAMPLPAAPELDRLRVSSIHGVIGEIATPPPRRA